MGGVGGACSNGGNLYPCLNKLTITLLPHNRHFMCFTRCSEPLQHFKSSFVCPRKALTSQRRRDAQTLIGERGSGRRGILERSQMPSSVFWLIHTNCHAVLWGEQERVFLCECITQYKLRLHSESCSCSRSRNMLLFFSVIFALAVLTHESCTRLALLSMPRVSARGGGE